MIKIDHFNLELPEELRHRARRIFEQVSKNLERQKFKSRANIATLTVPELEIDPSESDQKIADLIARQISCEIKSQGGCS